MNKPTTYKPPDDREVLRILTDLVMDIYINKAIPESWNQEEEPEDIWKLRLFLSTKSSYGGQACER